jgi:PAS domain S-box-containing protein
MDLGRFYDARPVTTVVVDLSGERRGRIAKASATFGDLLGCEVEDVLGEPLLDFVHPDDQQRAGREFARLAGGRCTTFDGIARVVHQHGEVHWLSVHANLTPATNPRQLLIRGFVLPVRMLDSNEARSRRASGTDKLHVALDVDAADSIAAAY